VERNRVKRRIREWFRRERRAWSGPLDVLVIARQPATQLASAEFNERLSRLIARAFEEA
jgi:ribonuclease P protein component